jgi:hypothetical protein
MEDQGSVFLALFRFKIHKYRTLCVYPTPEIYWFLRDKLQQNFLKSLSTNWTNIMHISRFKTYYTVKKLPKWFVGDHHRLRRSPTPPTKTPLLSILSCTINLIVCAWQYRQLSIPVFCSWSWKSLMTVVAANEPWWKCLDCITIFEPWYVHSDGSICR